MPKIILITSGSSDFGRAAAEEMADCGHRVFAGMRDPSGRNRERANALWAQSIEVIPIEMSDERSVEKCVDEVLARAGRIDVLVNNFDLESMQDFEELQPDQMLAIFDANVVGMFRSARAVLSPMRRQGGGLIVNVGETVWRVHAHRQTLLAACQRTLEALTDALRLAAAELGIRTVLFVPRLPLARAKDVAWKINATTGWDGDRATLRELVDESAPG